MDIRVTGGNQLRSVGRSLRTAGSPGRGVRSKMRKAIVAAVKPMQTAVKQSALAIPTTGEKSTGLREDIAKGTKIQIKASGATAVVRLYVDPKVAPLAALMDGERRWRHPVYGNTNNWVSQPSHPYFARPVTKRLPAVRKAVTAAVTATAAEIERGI